MDGSNSGMASPQSSICSPQSAAASDHETRAVVSPDVPAIKIDGPKDTNDGDGNPASVHSKRFSLSKVPAIYDLSTFGPHIKLSSNKDDAGSNAPHKGDYKKLMHLRYIRSEDGYSTGPTDADFTCLGLGKSHHSRLLLETTRSKSLDRTYDVQDQPLDLSRAKSHSSRQIFIERASAKHNRVARSDEDIPKHTRVTEMDRFNPLHSSPERPSSRQTSGGRQSSSESTGLSVDYAGSSLERGYSSSFDRYGTSLDRSSFEQSSLDRSSFDCSLDHSGSVDQSGSGGGGHSSGGSISGGGSFDRPGSEFDLASESSGITVVSGDGLLKPGSITPHRVMSPASPDRRASPVVLRPSPSGQAGLLPSFYQMPSLPDGVSPFYSQFLPSPPMPTSANAPMTTGQPLDNMMDSNIHAQLEALIGQSRANPNAAVHVCPMATCKLTFPSFDAFAKHIAKHLPTSTVAHPSGKLHYCQICARSFSRSDMLTRHMRLHTGIKPYECVHCKQVFSRSDHLNTHQRTHTGEKPYKCQHCPYAASRRDMITRHRRIHARPGGTGCDSGGRGRHKKRLGDTRLANTSNSSVESSDSFASHGSSLSSIDSSFEGDPQHRRGIWGVRQMLDPISSGDHGSLHRPTHSQELSSSSGGSTSTSLESEGQKVSSLPTAGRHRSNMPFQEWSSVTSTESVDVNDNVSRPGFMPTQRSIPDTECMDLADKDTTMPPRPFESFTQPEKGAKDQTIWKVPSSMSEMGNKPTPPPPTAAAAAAAHSAVSRRKSFVRQDASLEEDIDSGDSPLSKSRTVISEDLHGDEDTAPPGGSMDEMATDEKLLRVRQNELKHVHSQGSLSDELNMQRCRVDE